MRVHSLVLIAILMAGGACKAKAATVLAPDGGAPAAIPDAPAPAALGLRLVPEHPVVEVTGAPETLQFTAFIDDLPVTAEVAWTVDDVTVGVVSPAGLFRALGTTAGQVQVMARYGDKTASTVVTVKATLRTSDSGVSVAEQNALDQGGAVDPAFRWLYPYDRTVFPRGLAAPTLQFGGATAERLLITISVGDFRYRGYFIGGEQPRVELPAAVWAAVTRSAGAKDLVEVTATKLTAAGVAGPLTQAWRIAPADLKGIIYYNTYRSAQTNTGAVMRIRPGGNAEVMLGGCTVCHSVSAHGNVLAAGVNWGNGNPLSSAAYDLTSDGNVAARRVGEDGRKLAFAGLSPDGTLALSNGVPPTGHGIRGLSGATASRVYNTATGAEVAVPSFTSQVTYAMTPAFAPDGKAVAFHWNDGGGALATMTVDLTALPPAFGTVTTLLSQTGTGVLGWPSFLPDGKALVFQDGDRFDTAGYGGVPSYASIKLVDVGTKVVNDLKALNGLNADGSSYLPFGMAEENLRNYEPSVLPVPVGGYYWIIFTSRRAYGNTLGPGGSVRGSDDEWGGIVNGNEVTSTRKKLWVAALDLDYAGTTAAATRPRDPSHPAFYLPGQELEAGNMRAYAALEPCKDLGGACSSGAGCCSGFCRQTSTADDGQPVLTCVTPPNDCARTDEACTSPGDCCDALTGAICINQRCAEPNVIE